MSVPIPVVVIGAAGRIGSFACEQIEASEGFSLAGGIEIGEDLAPALATFGPDGEREAKVALEVTAAGLGLAHGLAILAAGLRPVIGTSGMDAAAVESLDRRALELGLGGIVVPNFCLGAWLLERLAVSAVAHFPAVEIIEEHHPDKLDAPSGTAAQLARLLTAAGAQGGRLDAEPGVEAEAGVEGEGEGGAKGRVPIHSLRLPGLHSNHTLRFGGAGETLTLRHETHDLAAFIPGLLASLGYAAGAEGVALGLGAAFI
ncbi:MAG: 4-hydroxy-tetrahydrodipicolinate reductase [Planctomycetota bacterium]|nr:4-hydroxy-tetrahydrodipicolinate reductase [Planctomycetota bacterium]MDP6838303.1 4-hydroxy-tetrahydrodipicolinate reductase [Planctomycetota bacterium]MDP6955634.1 4-hydroxy-tetrahydrodipicolinate reductase [Planctomycetota bacterium]